MGNVFPPSPNGDGIQRPQAPATTRTPAVAARWRPHHPQSGCEKIFCNGFCEDNCRFSVSRLASASYLSRRDRRSGEVDEMDEEEKEGRETSTPVSRWWQQKRQREEQQEVLEEEEGEEIGKGVEATRRHHRHLTKRHRIILTSVALDRAQMEQEARRIQYPRIGLGKGDGESIISQTVKEKGEEGDEEEDEKEEEEEQAQQQQQQQGGEGHKVVRKNSGQKRGNRLVEGEKVHEEEGKDEEGKDEEGGEEDGGGPQMKKAEAEFGTRKSEMKSMRMTGDREEEEEVEEEEEDENKYVKVSSGGMVQTEEEKKKPRGDGEEEEEREDEEEGDKKKEEED
ncbi:hypothetical protein VYU27_007567 [Nannochloropsis oceanica]